MAADLIVRPHRREERIPGYVCVGDSKQFREPMLHYYLRQDAPDLADEVPETMPPELVALAEELHDEVLAVDTCAPGPDTCPCEEASAVEGRKRRKARMERVSGGKVRKRRASH